MALQFRPAGETTKALRTAVQNGGFAVLQWLLAQDSKDDLLARIDSELTPRQKEVLWAYLAEQDDFELGYILQIQPQTVRNHLAKIERILDIYSRPALLNRILLALWRASKNLQLLDGAVTATPGIAVAIV